jgi:two-component system, OmpR family, sensor kinase
MVLPRIVPGGLRWRLAGWIAVVMVVCTGITFVAVYRGTGTQLRRQIDQEISGDAAELAHNLRSSAAHSPAQVARAASGYIQDQPFRASSTFLFAIVPGAGTSTNRPELFAHAQPDDGETVVQQDQENRLAGQLPAAPPGYATLALGDVGNLRLLERVVHVAGERVTIGVGEPLASVTHAQSGVARAFILAGVLALVGALLGGYLIGTRVTRPLRRMAAVAAQVDAGDLHPRIHDPSAQDEVRVLAEAFNHMLDRLTEAFAGQRAFVADASHELRTPLTVIRGQLEVLAAKASPSGGEVRRVERLLQAEIARISRLVDDLLLLTKAEQTRFLRTDPIALAGYVQELWDGMSLLAARRLELGPVPEGTLNADPDRLAQALRNLVGNAIEHTAAERGLVRLDVEPAGARTDRRSASGPGPSPAGDGSGPTHPGGAQAVRFIVQDDGPGIPPEQRERVFDRFHRTDAARDRASGGAGLGLAIVRAIAEAHGGRVSASESDAGGARIELELPRFTPAERYRPSSAETVGAQRR